MYNSERIKFRAVASETNQSTSTRPGDYLPADAEEISGFKDRLNERLAPTNPTPSDTDWHIGDTLAQWWRPNFETFMYPYLPGHVSRPKELKKLYLIQLPRTKVLSVPKNMKLLAVPLFELYENTARYGPQLSAIPHLLSRYNFEFVDEEDRVVAVTPGGGPMESSDGEVKGEKVLAGGDGDDEMNDEVIEENRDINDENGA
jgi:cleavage and polyadenylation specificity factor subunit 5